MLRPEVSDFNRRAVFLAHESADRRDTTNSSMSVSPRFFMRRAHSLRRRARGGSESCGYAISECTRSDAGAEALAWPVRALAAHRDARRAHHTFCLLALIRTGPRAQPGATRRVFEQKRCFHGEKQVLRAEGITHSCGDCACLERCVLARGVTASALQVQPAR